MTTAHKRWSNGVHLRHLTTQHSSCPQPILTSCTCPTLHHITRHEVDHLRGKTLVQIRNAMDMGVVGPRSLVAFCHMVLRENVLPAIATMSKLKLLENCVNKAAKSIGSHEMSSTT
jgi:hypothetical protein